jgi:hypothetical protein
MSATRVDPIDLHETHTEHMIIEAVKHIPRLRPKEPDETRNAITCGDASCASAGMRCSTGRSQERRSGHVHPAPSLGSAKILAATSSVKPSGTTRGPISPTPCSLAAGPTRRWDAPAGALAPSRLGGR